MQPARAIRSSGSDRRPGLDVLRAVATVLVVMLHAGVPYTVAPMPGLTWPVRHTSISPVVDVLFWGIEGAIMPLFFLLSGYGASQSLAHRAHDFLSTRWRRLGWPLLAAATVILPVELYIWLIGWAADGQIPWQKLRSLKLERFHEDLWGLSHLWYLEYLLIYSAALWAGNRYLDVKAWSQRFDRWRPWLPPRIVGLIAAGAVTLWFAPEVVVGFQHGFLPLPLKFAYSGLFFGAGVLEFHWPMSNRLTTKVAIPTAICLLVGLMPLIHRQVAGPLFGSDRLTLVIGLAAYAVLVTQASWQISATSQIAIVPAMSYLVKASFWVYLVHHPLVAIWQIGLRTIGWSALSQFVIVTLGTLAVSLVSYEWLVRRTWLADLLEGRRAAAIPPSIPLPTPAEIPIRRAA